MRQLLFISLGLLTIWLTMLASPTVLVCWYLNVPIATPLLITAAVSPLLVLIIISSLRGRNSPFRWWLMQALGAGTILMSVVLAASLLLLFLSPPTVAIVATVIWAVLLATAIHRAHNIQNTTLTINSPLITKSTRLVQISDVHIGSRTSAFLERVVEQVNTHSPDIVVITGDLLDSSSVTLDDLAPLARLSAKAYMCLGNHERYVDLDSAITAIEHHDVTLLRNATIDVQSLQLIGIDDYEKPDLVATHLENLVDDSTKFRVLLYHKPDGWPAASDNGVQLTLAGHTHAGQIWPFGYLVKRQYPNMAGVFSDTSSMLYVSQGTGTWGPIMRLFTDSEMTIINLHPEN